MMTDVKTTNQILKIKIRKMYSPFNIVVSGNVKFSLSLKQFLLIPGFPF